MLSRVADSLYWMSRYLERAEHTSRLLDVHLHAMLDLSPDSITHRWKRLTTILYVPETNLHADDVHEMARVLAFDAQNSDSLVACVAAARENARQVREQISSEMWEQLNQLYLSVIRTNIDQIWTEHRHDFFWSIREASHLFQGITDATMNHGQGWQFIQLGRYIERANATASLLGVFFADILQKGRALSAPSTDDYLEWVGLLKCVTAFEAYCKVYTADVRPDWIGEFLLLDPEFPRSVFFSAKTISGALEAIAGSTASEKSARPNRIAGRLLASLSFSAIEEIMAGGLQAYLNDIQSQCAQIHTAINQEYITYAVDAALPF